MEELLAKYFSKNATKDERTLVEAWRSESKEHADLFLNAKIVWLESEQDLPQGKELLETILSDEKKGLQYHLFNTSWLKYASAAVLVLAIGLLFVLKNSNEPDNYISYSLQDGSEIALHGDAKIELISFDESVREIQLTGKAYFTIERDENRPFIIHTNNATVKVLGTSFLIETNDTDTEVCVESGLVELIKNDEDISVTLEMGKMGLVSKTNKGIIKKDNDNPNYLSWKTKILTFKNDEMGEVRKVLEEVYGVQVKFENADFSQCKLTAKFNKKRPKDAIEIIARTFNVDYDFKNGIAILKGKGC